MPELPDLTVYAEALERHAGGTKLLDVELTGVSLLRTVEPPLSAVFGKRLLAVRRLGKRLVWAFEDELFLVLHLMIAGRLRWRPRDARGKGRKGLARFEFERGTVVLTEAGTKKRAKLHVVRGEAGLAAHDPGGIEPLASDPASFRAALGRENHTLKRALTDPHLVAGIGNAYSDEILHRARLSPVQLTANLDDDGWTRLHAATVATLEGWIRRHRDAVGEGFPDKVTAFHPQMAVHGRYGEPCPDCGAPVQRITRADNETNYCPRCQTGGRILADRALSRLLKRDWPRTLEELEERRPSMRTKPVVEAEAEESGRGIPGRKS